MCLLVLLVAWIQFFMKKKWCFCGFGLQNFKYKILKKYNTLSHLFSFIHNVYLILYKITVLVRFNAHPLCFTGTHLFCVSSSCFLWAVKYETSHGCNFGCGKVILMKEKKTDTIVHNRVNANLVWPYCKFKCPWY